MALAIQHLPIEEDGFQLFFTQPEQHYCLIEGDVREKLPMFPSQSIDMCLTSPPYIRALQQDTQERARANHWFLHAWLSRHAADCLPKTISPGSNNLSRLCSFPAFM